MSDEDYLIKAINLSKKSGEPVKCACVFVKDGAVLSEAYNSQRADQIVMNHAEVKAIMIANRKLGVANLRGVTAYCSCEPCVMCLTALSLAKVRRILYFQTMKEVSGGFPMGELNSKDFANKFLNFVPEIRQLKLQRILIDAQKSAGR